MKTTTPGNLCLACGLLALALAGCGISGDPSVQFRAVPNPIPVCKGDPGKTTLAWYVEAFREIEIRVNEPDGSLLAHSISHGSVQTGPWVSQGMELFLVDRKSRKVFSRLEVRLAEVDCPGGANSSP